MPPTPDPENPDETLDPNAPVEDPKDNDPDPENPPAEEDPKDTEPTLTLEEALAELEKVRKEAAAKRVKLREAESRLEAAKSTDEVEQIVAELKEERERAEHALLVENAALKFNLPPALAARVQGSTREEIEADAKALSEFAIGGNDPDPRGGLDPNEEHDNTPSDPAALARRVNRGRRAARSA